MVFTVTVTRVETRKEDGPSSWRAVLISFVASIPFFTHGLQSTQLFASSHAGHFIRSPEDVPWLATILTAAAAISAPIYCYLIDKFGRKVGLFIAVFIQAASCLPLYFHQNEITAYIFHALAGLSTGGLFTVLPIYINEINTIGSKGFSMSLMMLMTTAGYLMKMALRMDVILYLLTALVILQLLSLMVLVESPSYLVKQNKLEAAKAKLSALRCIEDDNSNLTQELEELKKESLRARAHGKLTLISIQKNLIWRDATKISVLLITTMVFCGSIVFLDQDRTLIQLKMASDPNKMLVLVAMCAGSLCTVLLIKFVERSLLLAIGFIVMVLSMGVLAVYTQMDLTVTSVRWLPVGALGVLVFGYGMAWALPIIITVEMFNFEIRATMVGALFAYSQIMKLILLHVYQYIEDYMGVYTLFYIFTAINLYGGVYGFFVIPHIKDRTMRQIEKQLKRIPLIKL